MTSAATFIHNKVTFFTTFKKTILPETRNMKLHHPQNLQPRAKFAPLVSSPRNGNPKHLEDPNVASPGVQVEIVDLVWHYHKHKKPENLTFFVICTEIDALGIWGSLKSQIQKPLRSLWVSSQRVTNASVFSLPTHENGSQKWVPLQ